MVGSTKLSAQQIERAAIAWDHRRLLRAAIARMKAEDRALVALNDYAREYGVTKQTLRNHVRQWLEDHGQPR